jgi:hypothetical protein
LVIDNDVWGNLLGAGRSCHMPQHVDPPIALVPIPEEEQSPDDVGSDFSGVKSSGVEISAEDQTAVTAASAAHRTPEPAAPGQDVNHNQATPTAAPRRLSEYWNRNPDEHPTRPWEKALRDKHSGSVIAPAGSWRQAWCQERSREEPKNGFWKSLITGPCWSPHWGDSGGDAPGGADNPAHDTFQINKKPDHGPYRQVVDAPIESVGSHARDGGINDFSPPVKAGGSGHLKYGDGTAGAEDKVRSKGHYFMNEPQAGDIDKIRQIESEKTVKGAAVPASGISFRWVFLPMLASTLVGAIFSG